MLVVVLPIMLLDIPPDLVEVEGPGEPEGPRERPATDGEVEAGQPRMQRRTATRPPAGGIGHDPRRVGVRGDHQAQQIGRGRPFPASHAGANRARTTGHWGVYPVAHPGWPASAAGSGAVSGRMSIRQPVSRAASRAFWPSLPIARLSW